MALIQRFDQKWKIPSSVSEGDLLAGDRSDASIALVNYSYCAVKLITSNRFEQECLGQ